MGNYSEEKIGKAIKFLDNSKRYGDRRSLIMRRCVEKCKKDGSYDGIKEKVYKEIV